MGTHKSERLPERLRQLLTEAYLANEKVYWQQREQLVQSLANKWVAVHNGQVVTVGEDMATVMDEVGKQGICDAYIEKVGGESDTVFTIRHRREIGFAYDSSYTPPIPRIEVKFLNFQQSHHSTYADVIPDTGADNTVLPFEDCAAISIFPRRFIALFLVVSTQRPLQRYFTVTSRKLADICPPLSLNPIPLLTDVYLDATY